MTQVLYIKPYKLDWSIDYAASW